MITLVVYCHEYYYECFEGRVIVDKYFKKSPYVCLKLQLQYSVFNILFINAR